MAFTQDYVNQLVKEAATQAGGTLSYADAANAAKNIGISDSMLQGALSTGFITGAPSAAPAAAPAAPAAPLYQGLTATSTPDQIAAAYSQFTSGAGGDTKANQDTAIAYLRNAGIADAGIMQGYEKFLQPPASLTPTSTNIGTATAAAAPTITDAQVASYIQNNNLSGMGLQEAASVFGVGQDQVQRAQQLISANDPSVKAANDIYALQVAGRPDLVKQNLETYNPATGLGSAVGIDDLYAGILGTQTKPEDIDYWKNLFGDSIDADEREQFRKSSATDINKQFGVTGNVTAPTTEGILSGFKYAKNSGISEDALKKTLGEDVFNTYKTGFADYAKTGIANILADNKLSFDEASTAVKFGRDYGYDSQKLADLTGQKKELFDTINKTYSDTAKKVITSAIKEGPDVKDAGDQVVRALALQQKYGFTDEDLAGAIDFTPAQVKGYLDPVRNYATTYKDTLSKPDVSGNDILKFLEESKKNEGVGKLYGSNIDTQITRLNELNDKWKDYKVDGYQAENIANQVSQITKAADGKNWSGSWMGGGDNAKNEAVAVLMKKGVDNLSDLKVEKNYEKTPVDQEFYNGQRVYQGEDGSKYTLKTYSNGGDDVQTTAEFLPPDAKTTPGKVVMDYSGGGDYGGSTYTFQPLTADELKTYDPKTGKFDKDVGNKLIDKSTGKVVGTSGDNNFVLDRYETGNFFKSKDKSMGIMMTDQGVPVPYQTTEKGGLVYSPIMPILLSLAMPGVASAVSGALPGAGVAAAGAAELGFSAAVAPTLTNTMLTQGIMGAGTAALTGQDPLKGAFFGAVGAPISTGIGSLLPTGMDPAVARAITSGGTGVVKGVLQGGDFEDLLGQGVLSGLTNYGLGEATKSLNLTPQQLNLATGIAAPLLQGKDINPMNLIGPLAQMGQQQTTKATP